jgi:hypothetical protein
MFIHPKPRLELFLQATLSALLVTFFKLLVRFTGLKVLLVDLKPVQLKVNFLLPINML